MIEQKEIINLDSLIDFSNKLNSTQDHKFIYSATLLTLIGKLKITRAAIYVKKDIYTLVSSKGHQFLQFVNSLEELKSLGHQLFPINYGSVNLGYLLLGSKINSIELTESEEKYLNLIISITANALDNANNYNDLLNEKIKLEKKNHLFRTLLSINEGFNKSIRKTDIIRVIYLSLMGQLMINKLAVFLIENSSYKKVFDTFKDINFDNSILKGINTDIYYVKEDDKELFDSGVKIVSLLRINDKIEGYILIGEKLVSDFTDEDIDFLRAMSVTSVNALENNRLILQEIEKKNIDEELKMALKIQEGLLPKGLPTTKDLEIYSYFKPEKSVGGDYYDYINSYDDKVRFLIADVSGKGVPASIIMSNLQSLFRALAPLNISIEDLVNRMNDIIYENTSADKFISLFIADYCPNSNNFNYVNCGHNPAFLIKDDISELSSTNTLVGINPSPLAHSKSLKLEVGDTVFLYTDGLVEASDSNNKQFGIEKLKSILFENCKESPQVMGSFIVNSLNDYSDRTKLQDDTTILIIKKTC